MVAPRPPVAIVIALVAWTACAEAAPKAYVVDYDDALVLVVDTASNRVVSSIPVGIAPSTPAISHDGRLIYVPNFGSDSISIIDGVTDTVIDTIEGVRLPAQIVLSPADDRAYVTLHYYPGELAIFDTTERRQVNSVGVGKLPASLAISPDGSRVYVVNTYDDAENNPCNINHGVCNLTVSIVDAVTEMPVGSFDVGGSPRWISVGPSGSPIYVQSIADGLPSIAVYHPELLHTFRIPGAGPFVLNAGGDLLYLAESFSIAVIDTATRTRVATSPILSNWSIDDLTWTPDERRLYATVSSVDQILVVDPLTLLIVDSVDAPNPSAIAIAPDLTPSPAATATPSPSPCPGDCNGDGAVESAEILDAIEAALLGDDTLCGSADGDRNGRVSVDELVVAVARHLGRCG